MQCSLVHLFNSFFSLGAIKGDLIKCTSPPQCITRGFITAARSKCTEWKGRLSQQLFSRKHNPKPKNKKWLRRLGWERHKQKIEQLATPVHHSWPTAKHTTTMSSTRIPLSFFPSLPLPEQTAVFRKQEQPLTSACHYLPATL